MAKSVLRINQVHRYQIYLVCSTSVLSSVASSQNVRHVGLGQDMHVCSSENTTVNGLIDIDIDNQSNFLAGSPRIQSVHSSRLPAIPGRCRNIGNG